MSNIILYATRFKSLLVYFEKTLIISSFILLLILTSTQLISRNLFDSGFPIFDIISRHIIFFIIFPGAALSCEGNKNIKLDILTPLLSTHMLTTLQMPLAFISSIVCFTFAWYSGSFFIDELKYAAVNEQFSAYMTISIPAGFFLLGIHLLLLSITNQSLHSSKASIEP
ncbi:MAG: TRAP transporter small permease [Gammaproteobacteria bacterium]|nr:TRAP transporter small permease [Gammaproteobacteria bacterium]